MSCNWYGIVVVLAAIISPTARAADPIVKPSTQPPTSAPTPPRETIPPPKRAAIRSASVVTTGALLRSQSQQAFHRGLLPLTDLLEHLAAAEEADVRWVLSTLPSDSAPSSQAILSAIQPRIESLRFAVRHMEAFRQPAAANWQADVLLGKYVLAEAIEEAARLSGDHEAIGRAVGIESAIAIKHYQQRIFDAKILGHATLPDVTRAVSFLNIDPTRKRRVLQQAIGTTQRWNAMAAGIGRSDQVLNASLQVALWDAEPRSSQLNDAVLQHGLTEADRLATQLFSTQRSYYSRGTATLADLSRAWQTRRQVHLLADVVGTPLPDNSPNSYQRDLNELQNLAVAIQDRRGRNATDVAYVHLLSHLHAGDPAGKKPVQ